MRALLAAILLALGATAGCDGEDDVVTRPPPLGQGGEQ